MQIPSTPWSTMQSSTRRCPSRSTSPAAVKGVGAIGKTPANGLDGEGFTREASGSLMLSCPRIITVPGFAILNDAGLSVDFQPARPLYSPAYRCIIRTGRRRRRKDDGVAALRDNQQSSQADIATAAVPSAGRRNVSV